MMKLRSVQKVEVKLVKVEDGIIKLFANESRGEVSQRLNPMVIPCNFV